MNTYRMNLQPKYLSYIKGGTKRIELRLFDEKRQKIKIGDTIIFWSTGDDEISCMVTGLLHYANFELLLNDFDISMLADATASKQEILDDLDAFYPVEKQAELGVLGIRFEPDSLSPSINFSYVC